jgi:hypothetical protein
MRRETFVLFALLLASVVTPAAAQPVSFTFILGFAALHSAIPGIVGDCAASETHNPINGDGLQSTTNGLLVRRKADNLTAFTNGSQTWIDGPFGIQIRLDGQRFSYEPNPDRLPIVPPPVDGDRCHTAGLSLSSTSVDVGAGNLIGTFEFTNELNVGCTLFGFAGAQRPRWPRRRARPSLRCGGGRLRPCLRQQELRGRRDGSGEVDVRSVLDLDRLVDALADARPS